MTAVFITVYRQRTLPKINEERSVQGKKKSDNTFSLGNKFINKSF